MLARAAFLLLMLSKAAGVVAHEPSLSRFNYGEHVLPIFQRHCAGCHRGGGAGPMSLLDYQAAVPWANAIKLALLEDRMPPFLPSDESGPFQHARALSAEELDILVDWSVGATPEGEPIGEAAPPREEPSKADLVLQASSEIVLDEDEYEKTACVVLPSGLEHPRIATSFELVSRTPSILRRATVFVGDSCAADAEPLGTWLPDQGRVSFPDGFGREIASASSLALGLRYVKSWEDEGKRMADQTALGLWFSDDAAIVRTMRIAEPRWPVKEPGLLLTALYPAPADESPLRVDLVLPDGGTRLLLSIESFDVAWSEKYFFREPVLLPVGAQIRVSHPVVWADLGEP